MDHGACAVPEAAGRGGLLIVPPDVSEILSGVFLLDARVDDFDVRSAVLVGEAAAVVWDTLAHPSQMEAVHALAGGLPLSVVYSHADWDHAWGTCAFPDVAEVVAHQAATGRFLDDAPAELAARRSAEPARWGVVRLVPPTRTFPDALSLDLGGLTLRLAHLPGHTPDCIVGYVPERRLLLAGDTVETPHAWVNDVSEVPGWLDGLKRWAEDDAVDVVVPAHGRIGDRDVIEETMAFLRSVLATA